MPRPRVIVAVEGNIGAGKSTLLQRLLPSLAPLGGTILPEPVQEWSRSGLLQRFYDDPKRWAFSFQMFALMTRLRNAQETTGGELLVMERSGGSDRHIFAAQCKASGLFTPAEGVVYDQFHEWLTPPADQDAVVYLRCSPAVCHARVLQRARPEEATLTLEYLEALHGRHEAWLLSLPRATPVLVIDDNEDDVAAVLAFFEQLLLTRMSAKK